MNYGRVFNEAPSWTHYLFCFVCCQEFSVLHRPSITLECGHTICHPCWMYNRQCQFYQTIISTNGTNLLINTTTQPLLSNGSGDACVTTNGRNSAMGSSCGESEKDSPLKTQPSVPSFKPDDLRCYQLAKGSIEKLSIHLRLSESNGASPLSRTMQRKLATLIDCPLLEDNGRVRAVRAARALGERTVTELIVQHQKTQELNSILLTSLRARGCQFLGPKMQKQVLQFVLLALEDELALPIKVLIAFVVQHLKTDFPNASKSNVRQVLQLLNHCSCFTVIRRACDSTLMQLKEEYRTYNALRRKHDFQIVLIATEAGLRLDSYQWSSMLYGDTFHQAYMQSVAQTLQTPLSFVNSIEELIVASKRTGDPVKLEGVRTHLRDLAKIYLSLECASPTWEAIAKVFDAALQVVDEFVELMQRPKKTTGGGQRFNSKKKNKILLCRDLTTRRLCPRGASCTYAHSQKELERYRRPKIRKSSKASVGGSGISPQKSQKPQETPNNSSDLTHSKRGAFCVQDEDFFKQADSLLNDQMDKCTSDLITSWCRQVSLIGNGEGVGEFKTSNITNVPFGSSGACSRILPSSMENKCCFNLQCESNTPLPLRVQQSPVDSNMCGINVVFSNLEDDFNNVDAFVDNKIDNNIEHFNLNGLNIGDIVDDSSTNKKNLTETGVTTAAATKTSTSTIAATEAVTDGNSEYLDSDIMCNFVVELDMILKKIYDIDDADML